VWGLELRDGKGGANKHAQEDADDNNNGEWREVKQQKRLGAATQKKIGVKRMNEDN
jgi:hypothetical protein